MIKTFKELFEEDKYYSSSTDQFDERDNIKTQPREYNVVVTYEGKQLKQCNVFPARNLQEAEAMVKHIIKFLQSKIFKVSDSKKIQGTTMFGGIPTVWEYSGGDIEAGVSSGLIYITPNTPEFSTEIIKDTAFLEGKLLNRMNKYTSK